MIRELRLLLATALLHAVTAMAAPHLTTAGLAGLRALADDLAEL